VSKHRAEPYARHLRNARGAGRDIAFTDQIDIAATIFERLDRLRSRLPSANGVSEYDVILCDTMVILPCFAANRRGRKRQKRLQIYFGTINAIILDGVVERG
jgi:hypothetical protein